MISCARLPKSRTRDVSVCAYVLCGLVDRLSRDYLRVLDDTA